ncbi:MAG: Minf_1886 family protein [bacterium]
MLYSSYEETMQAILREDTRYDREAYAFIKESWDYTVKMLKGLPDGPRHVTGKELLEGFRAYAMEEFGPIAKRVLNTWGIRRSEDVGEIVFNLVNKGFFGKQDSDKKEDFAGGFDFDEAFVRPFQPAPRHTKPLTAARRTKRQRNPLK